MKNWFKLTDEELIFKWKKEYWKQHELNFQSGLEKNLVNSNLSHNIMTTIEHFLHDLDVDNLGITKLTNEELIFKWKKEYWKQQELNFQSHLEKNLLNFYISKGIIDIIKEFLDDLGTDEIDNNLKNKND